MEGYLRKRSEGGLLGSVQWKRRWFILEGATLRAFDSYDAKTAQAKNEQKTLKIDSTWKVNRVTTKDWQYTFILTHDNQKSWYLQADTLQEMDFWLSEINIVILESNPNAFAFDSAGGSSSTLGFYHTLGMAKDMAAGTKVVTEESLQSSFHAAKRQILRGGASSDSAPVQERIHVLKRAFYAVHEKHFGKERHEFKHLKYDCTLTKVPVAATATAAADDASDGNAQTPRGKLGITFAESSAHTGWIKVKAYDDDIQVSNLGAAAKGKIRIHDALYSINGQVVGLDWTVARVAQRLNAASLPVGESVQLVLCRRYQEESDTAGSRSSNVHENLSDDYIISHEMTDSVPETPISAASSTATAAAAAAAASNDTDGRAGKGEPAEPSEPASTEAESSSEGASSSSSSSSVRASSGSKRPSLLQRARASFSWGGGGVFSKDSEASATDADADAAPDGDTSDRSSSSSSSSSAKVGGGKVHSARANSESTGVGVAVGAEVGVGDREKQLQLQKELAHLRESHAGLEARLEMYKKKASSAEDQSRNTALQLENAQLDLAIVRKEAARQQEEVADLRKLLRSAEAAAAAAAAQEEGGPLQQQSKRAFPLHRLGMQEKISRLKQRYQLEPEGDGEGEGEREEGRKRIDV